MNNIVELLQDVKYYLEATENPTIWKVVPNSQVGPIKMGMKREDVRNIFSNAKEFKKTKNSKNTTDNFEGFHVYYTGDNTVEAVEIFKNIEVSLNGKTLFPSTVKEFETSVTGLKKEKGNYFSVEKSIGISFDDENGKIDSILIGNKGYYKSEGE